MGGFSTLVTTDRWGEGVFREARRLTAAMLAGVGTGELVELVKPACLHVRRALSTEEIGSLSAEWLAIPARDEFTEAGGMEMRL
jgi:hypothetical protein